MAKGKKNTSKGKSRYVLQNAKPRVHNKGGLSLSSKFAGDLKQVNGLSDPFCPAARGAKVPDSDSSRSVAVTVTNETFIVTDGNGNAAVEFNPSITSMTRGAASLSTTQVITWAAAVDATDKAAIDGAFDQYRIVSWGIRVTPTNTPLNQSGTIKVITTSEPATTPFNTAGGLHEATSSFPNYGSEVYWISKPKGNSHLDYVDITDTCDWDRCVIHIRSQEVGKTVALVEIIMNIECQVALNTISASTATEAAEHKPHVLAAANKVHNKRAHAHNGSGESLSSKLWGFAKSALAEAAGAAIPYVGGAVKNLLTSGGGRRNPAIMDRVIEVD